MEEVVDMLYFINLFTKYKCNQRNKCGLLTTFLVASIFYMKMITFFHSRKGSLVVQCWPNSCIDALIIFFWNSVISLAGYGISKSLLNVGQIHITFQATFNMGPHYPSVIFINKSFSIAQF